MFVCAECGASQPTEGHCTADGTLLAARGEDMLLGTTIGAYRVARLLGIGGMGRVYKGVHPSIGSRVAIKVLSRECSDRHDLVERFFSEAKAVNVIKHESIVNVLDLAMLPDGRPYIIMEYLDGSPLSAIVDSIATNAVQLPLGGLARVVAEVLDALGAAHAKGIVHRDLKPDNIFVTPSGRPKVLDFGIAKLSDLGSSSTRSGSLLGTPHYMSPEQAMGQSVDLRSDLYAMGVILFECTTGHKPFTAESLYDLLRKHVEMPPPSPRAWRADMPPELESVILTALAKTADQRFGSAQAMSVALQHATSRLAPEQWLPITTQAATSPGGWTPTVPASWQGRSSQPSTVSAGQVTAPSRETLKKRQSKGVWIALAAIAIVGGGVTAAVVAGGRGGAGSVVAQGSATGGDAASSEGTPTPVAPADTKPTAPVAPAETKTTAPVAPADTKPTTPVAPADAKPAAPGERANKPAERVERPDDTTSSGGTAAPVALIAKPASMTAPGAWIENHDLPSPSGFNPKHVDVAKFIPFAIAQARKAIPDAEMYRIDVEGVSPDGFADLTLPTLASEHGSIDIRFTSPAHSTRDPKQPIGTPAKTECEFRVEATPTGVELNKMFPTNCKEKPLPVPRCSVAAMWRKAIAKGAPGANAVANLGFRNDFHGRPTWYFDIGFGMDVAFSQLFHDDC